MSLHVGDHVHICVYLVTVLLCVSMHLCVCAQWGLCAHMLSLGECVHLNLLPCFAGTTNQSVSL